MEVSGCGLAGSFVSKLVLVHGGYRTSVCTDMAVVTDIEIPTGQLPLPPNVPHLRSELRQVRSSTRAMFLVKSECRLWLQCPLLRQHAALSALRAPYLSTPIRLALLVLSESQEE